MPTVVEKRAQFRQLHETGCFVLPNPWDIGTALYLQHRGARAIATTSAGFAFSRGLADGAVPVEMMIEHIREMSEATQLPLNADFEHGYADEIKSLVANVQRVIDAGASGLSIEDSTGRKEQPLVEISEAAERIAAAHEVTAASNTLLVGRAECFLVGRDDIDETIRRLQAYAAAGADCLYAPGVSGREHVKAIVEAVAPKPVNLLISAPGGLSVEEAAALGIRRVSVGGALARAAWGGFRRGAEELLQHGSFGGFAEAMPHSKLQTFFQR